MVGGCAACTKRVEARGDKNTETCTQEFFAFVHCVDHCVRHGGGGPRAVLLPLTSFLPYASQVSQSLFKHLK